MTIIQACIPVSMQAIAEANTNHTVAYGDGVTRRAECGQGVVGRRDTTDVCF